MDVKSSLTQPIIQTELMKKIHFDHIGGNRKWLLLSASSLIIIFVGLFELIDFSVDAVNQWLIITGIGIQIVFLSKLFWHRNVVQWNSKGVVIRIKSYLGKSFKFSDIESTYLTDKKLSITLKNGKQFQFDLNEFSDSDSMRLNNILLNRVLN